MGDAQHPRVSHLCNPCFCSSGSPSGPHCWFFCRILLDVTSVSAADSLSSAGHVFGGSRTTPNAGFHLAEPALSSGHSENYLKNCCSFL